MGAYKIELTNVILSGGPVTWPFVRGGSSAEVPLIVDTIAHEQIRQLGGEQFLRYDGPGVDLNVSRIGFIKQGKAVGASRVLYILGDRRFLVQGLIVDKLFNGIRRINERLIVKGNVDPNIAQFAAHPKRNYIRHTCRKESIDRNDLNQRFASGVDDDFEPWTALGALRYLLSDGGWIAEKEAFEFDGVTPFTFGPVDFSGATERKILLRGWNPKSHWGDAVDYLLRRARMSLFVDPEGNFVVRDLEPDNAQFSGFGLYAGAGGIPIREDLTKSAPQKIKIRYRKRFEIRFNYSEQLDFKPTQTVERGAQGNKIDLRVRNVFKLPQEILQFQRAQVVPASDAIDAWDKDPEPDNNPRIGLNGPFGFPWELARIKRYFLHQALAHNYSIDWSRPQFKNEILESRVAEVYQSFRTLFQLPELLLDYIEDLDERSVEIIDPATGRRQPQPVAVDYLAWDSVLHHNKRGNSKGGKNSTVNPQANQSNSGQGHVRNHPIAKNGDLTTKDPAKFKFEDLVTSPARIVIDDQTLGLVKLDFVKDLKGTTVAYDPGLALNIPSYRFITRQRRFFTREMILLDLFRLSFKLSIRFRSNNEETKFLSLVGDTPSTYGITRAEGPILEKFFPGFEAGYEWTEGQTLEIDSETNQLAVNGVGANALINEGIIQDIAEAEYSSIWFDYRPRIIGFYGAPGWTGNLPSGQAEQVLASYAGNGRMETILGASRPVPRPSNWEFFDPVTRNFVGRFIEGTLIE